MKSRDKFPEKALGVFVDDDVEYYRTPGGKLVAVSAEEFFSVDGLRKHLPVSLAASMAFCCKQQAELGIVADGVQKVVEALIAAGSHTPANDACYSCLLAEWLGNALVSSHLVALFLNVFHRVLSPLPENEVNAYFPFDPVGRAIEEFERQEPLVCAVLGRKSSETDEDGLGSAQKVNEWS